MRLRSPEWAFPHDILLMERASASTASSFHCSAENLLALATPPDAPQVSGAALCCAPAQSRCQVLRFAVHLHSPAYTWASVSSLIKGEKALRTGLSTASVTSAGLSAWHGANVQFKECQVEFVSCYIPLTYLKSTYTNIFK